MKIDLRPIKECDLKYIEKSLKDNSLPWLKGKKLEEQKKGNPILLIVWKDKEPIGHVQLRLTGSTSLEVKGKLRKCPNLETLYVKEKYRKQGVGTQIMNFCEKLISKKYSNKLGLAVEKENKFLWTLYHKRGYQDWGMGFVTETWQEVHENKIKNVSHKCNYLIKKLK